MGAHQSARNRQAKPDTRWCVAMFGAGEWFK
jgi:hypothetical protein